VYFFAYLKRVTQLNELLGILHTLEKQIMSTNTIELRLTLDNSEALQALGITEEKLLELVKASSTLNEVALQNMSKELLAVAAGSENAEAAVTEFIRANQMSEKQIAEVTNNLKEQRQALAINSTAYAQVSKTIEAVTAGHRNMTTTMHRW
jgi:hypothetical protein